MLVDNVFAHTPEGTPLRVSLRHEPASRQAVLRVTDAGPGFPSVRVPRAGSTGLGLDIAERTAVGVGGSLRIGTARSGGAVVEVTLPVVQRGQDSVALTGCRVWVPVLVLVPVSCERVRVRVWVPRSS